MANIFSLPTETYVQIAQYCDTPSQLAGMARASRRLYHVFNTELYRLAVKNKHPGITILAAANGQLATLKVAASFSANFNKASHVPPWHYSLKYWDWDLDNPVYGDAPWGTPLHLAVLKGHKDVVQWLLELKVDVDAPGRFLCRCSSVTAELESRRDIYDVPAWTPLHLAICKRHVSIFCLLLDDGTSHLDSIFKDLERFQTERFRMQNAPHLWFNFNNNGPITAIHTAAAVGDAALMALLVKDCRVDIDMADGHNATPLHYAIMGDSPSTVARALSLGADPWRTVQRQDLRGHYTPIQLALCYNKTRAATMLLQHWDLAWSQRSYPLAGRTSRELILKRLLVDRDAGGCPIGHPLLRGMQRHFPQLIQATCEAYREAPEDKEPVSTQLESVLVNMISSDKLALQDLDAILSSGEVHLENEVRTDPQLRLNLNIPRGLPLTLGSLALRAAVMRTSLYDHDMLDERVRWLLDHGADSHPIEREGDRIGTTGSIGILLERLSNMFDFEVEGNVLPGVASVINALAQAGSWSAPTYDDGIGRALLTKYVRAIRNLRSCWRPDAEAFHEMVHASMPVAVRELTTSVFDESLDEPPEDLLPETLDEDLY